jgi:LPXTG-motif cell wall-anchored protein
MKNAMITRPIWVVMAVFSFVIAMFVGVNAHASVIDSSPFVDKITSSQNVFQPREIGEISMEFSEKEGHEFQPGDELVFTLPEEFKGFANKMMLEDYAEVIVEANRVRVIFNDKVTKKNHIKGSLKFSIKATENIERGTSKEVNLDLGTKANPFPNVTVHGYPVANEGDGGNQTAPDFAYKGGNVNENDAELIDWYIVVNAGRLQVSGDTLVRDTLGKGHEFVEGSITINGQPLTAEQGKLVVNGNSFEMTLRDAAVSGNTIGINYQTRLTEDGKKQKTLSNDFKADYQILNESPTSIEGASSVKNVLMSGAIEGDEEEEKTPTEETEEIPFEEVEELEEVTPDHGNVTEEEDNMHNVDGSKEEEIHVDGTEENVPFEEVEELEEVTPENGNVTEQENNANESAEVTQPEVHIAPEETKPTPEVIEPKKEEKITPKKENKTTPKVTAPKTVKSIVPAKKEEKTVAPVSKKAVAKSETVKAAELPNTGSEDNKLFAVVGLVLMAFAGLLFRRRSAK